VFILVKDLLYTTMPKILTDEERAAQHAFYLPNIIDGSGSRPCSVCGCDTRSYFSSLAHIALCSGKCEKLYADQWRHFGIDPRLGNKLAYNGNVLQYDTNILVINSGEVCIEAWNPQKGVTASRVFIPLSQRDEIVQLPY
jgi:hypothetical protein